MSVYDTIRRHHHDLAGGFDRCLGLVSDAVARRDAFEHLRNALLAHAHAEEVVLYSRLQGPLLRRAIEARREHHAQAELLARLDRLPADHPDFQYQLVALHRAFQRHVEAEERDLFALAEQQIGPDDDDSLGQEWLRLEQQAELD